MIANNNQRAERIADIIRGYSGEDIRTDLKDVLGDLRHLADALGLDFGAVDKASHWMYRQEVQEDGGPADYLEGEDEPEELDPDRLREDRDERPALTAD